MEIRCKHERGATTLEFTALCVVVAMVVGLLGTALTGSGPREARMIAGALRRAIGGADAERDAAQTLTPEPFDYARRAAKAGRSWKSSDDAPSVPASDLHMNAVLPSEALWDATRTAAATGPAGSSAKGTVRMCMVCVDASWRDSVRAGSSTSGSFDLTKGDLFNGEVRSEARIGAVGIDLIGIVQQRAGWGGWKIQGRGRGTVGADLSGKLTARVEASGVELSASGAAMAGAVARGEVRAGIDLLGASISTRARVEGWAGAGVRGNASVTRTGTTFSWDAGVGAAVGLGGSLEWGGSVDVSQVDQRQREIGLSTLAVAANAVFPGSGSFFQSMPFTRGH